MHSLFHTIFLIAFLGIEEKDKNENQNLNILNSEQQSFRKNSNSIYEKKEIKSINFAQINLIFKTRGIYL